MRKIAVLSAVTVLAVVSFGAVEQAAAEKLRGSQFITAMKSNTLSGKTQDGASFNVFFLPGGKVTYEDSAGVKDHGNWRLDQQDDVCVTWNTLDQGNEQCFVVTANGSKLSWRGKTDGGRGSLRGTVVDSSLEPR